MMVPVSENRTDTVHPPRPSDDHPSSDRTTRPLRLRPTWHLVIFPVGCAALARSVLHLLTGAAGPGVTCAVYAAGVLIGIALAAVMERASHPEIARGTSGIVGSVTFALTSYLSNDLSGAAALLTIYVFSAVVTHVTTTTRHEAARSRRHSR